MAGEAPMIRKTAIAAKYEQVAGPPTQVPLLYGSGRRNIPGMGDGITVYG